MGLDNTEYLELEITTMSNDVPMMSLQIHCYPIHPKCHKYTYGTTRNDPDSTMVELSGLEKLKISPVHSYLRVLQAAGQVRILIVLVKINFFPHTCHAGQVPISRYFEAWL